MQSQFPHSFCSPCKTTRPFYALIIISIATLIFGLLWILMGCTLLYILRTNMVLPPSTQLYYKTYLSSELLPLSNLTLPLLSISFLGVLGGTGRAIASLVLFNHASRGTPPAPPLITLLFPLLSIASLLPLLLLALDVYYTAGAGVNNFHFHQSDSPLAAPLLYYSHIFGVLLLLDLFGVALSQAAIRKKRT